MADVTGITIARGRLGATKTLYVVKEASPIDTDDTVTFSEFTKVSASATFRLDTGVKLTTTEATNVVTITTAALVDVPIVVIATGY